MNDKYRSYKITTPAANLAIDLQRVYDHLRRDGDAPDDDYVKLLVRSAIGQVERRCGIALITQTVEDMHDGFPDDGSPLQMRISPAATLTHVKYYDTDGVLQTWSSSNYITDFRSIKGRIGLAEGVSYPDTQDRINSVTVTYTAGFGATAANVPFEIQAAILLMVGRAYENREDSVETLPTAAQNLLSQWMTDRVPA